MLAGSHRPCAAACVASTLALACSGHAKPAPAAAPAASPIDGGGGPAEAGLRPIAGSVATADGSPVAGALVAAFALDGALFDDAPRATARSGPDGAFELRVPEGREYAVTATTDAQSPAYATTADAAGGAVELVVGATPATILTGSVALASGRPAPSAMVRIFPGDRKPYEIYVAVADDAGRYRVAVEKRKLMLIATHAEATFTIERADLRTAAIDRVDFRLRPPPAPPPTDVTAELAGFAIPIDMTGAEPEQPHAARIEQLLCDARIVAIGESTHGSPEFARLRGRVLLQLARRCGFNALLLEADMSVGAAIDDYVLTGAGDPAALLTDTSSWPFAHQETLSLLRTIRAHNETATAPIHVLGFDPYFTHVPAAKLLDYVAARDKKAHARLLPAFAVFARDDFRQYYPQAPAAEQAQAKAAIEDARGFLAADRKRRHDERAWLRAQLHLRAIATVEERMSAPREDGGAIRDRALAAHAQWLVDEYLPGARAVMWAHNGHVLLGRPVWKIDAMGDLLADAFGDRYVSVGTLFGRGRFLAIGMVDGEIDDFRTFELERSPAGSLEDALSRVGAPAFLLDLSAVSPPTRAWLDSELEHREVGALHAVGGTGVQHTALVSSYHVVAFIDEITAIEPLDGMM
jgi:erythromycin esterase